MKKLLTVLIVFVYFVPVAFIAAFLIIAQDADDSPEITAFAIPVIFMIIVCGVVAVNIVAAIISAGKSICLPFRTVMVFKLCLIPFYLVNFACWAMGSMIFHIAIIVWMILPFVIAYTYFTMLGTSVYIICKLFALRRCGAITTKQLVVHFILQTMFTIDVIDSIYLSVKQKKLEANIRRLV